MSSFSERNGYRIVDGLPQIECMNKTLRITLYNVLYEFLELGSDLSWSSSICKAIFIDCWRLPIDELPMTAWGFADELKEEMMVAEWYEVYDLIEFIYKVIGESPPARKGEIGLSVSVIIPGALSDKEFFKKVVNDALGRENSGYRLVGHRIVPFIDENEYITIEDSLSLSSQFSGVRMHISSSVEHLAKRPEPDLRNAVKEAICAVEAAGKGLMGDESADLSQILQWMKKNHIVHPALIEGWKKIYGFTSDENGIRHGSSTDEVNIDFALAKYMLVSCSSFANYIVQVGRQRTSVDSE